MIYYKFENLKIRYSYFRFKYVSASCILVLVYRDGTIIRCNGKAQQIGKENGEKKNLKVIKADLE